MVTSNQNSDVEIPQKSPLVFILAAGLLILLIAAALYLQLQKSAITDEKNRIAADLKSIQTQIELLESKKVEAAQVAQQWLDTLRKEEILWSQVLVKIKSLVPQDTDGVNTVDFLSYSGAQDGKLTLNAQTKAAKVEPFEDISNLIAAFNSSAYFKKAFVPNITRGETDTGDKLLSFIFTVNYVEETFDGIGVQIPVAVDSQTQQVQGTEQAGQTQETKVKVSH